MSHALAAELDRRLNRMFQKATVTLIYRPEVTAYRIYINVLHKGHVLEHRGLLIDRDFHDHAAARAEIVESIATEETMEICRYVMQTNPKELL